MNPIVTLTLNPALDLETEVERIVPDHKLRCAPPRRNPGGGGINVARMVHHLGGHATAVYLSGGPTGDTIGALLDEEGVDRLAMPASGTTRQSLNVVERASGHEFRFVLPGSDLSALDWDDLAERLGEEAKDVDWLVASGSLPPGAPDDIYRRVAMAARKRSTKVGIDTSGPALAHALGPGICFVKPSLRELSELLGRNIEGRGAVEKAARLLVEDGRAEIVAVTLGADGACLASRDELIWMTPPVIEPLSSVGAGDSFVAGLTLGLCRGQSLREAGLLAMATAAAILLTPGTKPFERRDVDRLLGAIGEAE
ncbi:MAG TPA: 1-phosphofructokinase family hexose kinase [Alphaproteobacteria bacterium]|nr:1-phosphofructokinase family hexose kinase [Alphaproteobacteria bacterium]